MASSPGTSSVAQTGDNSFEKRMQNYVIVFFRNIGLEATTNQTVKDVRTKHAIDVYVKSHHVGFGGVWMVKCKHWNTPVSRLHVLALREIVAGLGADRGILLCEAGIQMRRVGGSDVNQRPPHLAR